MKYKELNKVSVTHMKALTEEN